MYLICVSVRFAWIGTCSSCLWSSTWLMRCSYDMIFSCTVSLVAMPCCEAWSRSMRRTSSCLSRGFFLFADSLSTEDTCMSRTLIIFSIIIFSCLSFPLFLPSVPAISRRHISRTRFRAVILAFRARSSREVTTSIFCRRLRASSSSSASGSTSPPLFPLSFFSFSRFSFSSCSFSLSALASRRSGFCLARLHNLAVDIHDFLFEVRPRSQFQITKDTAVHEQRAHLLASKQLEAVLRCETRLLDARLVLNLHLLRVDKHFHHFRAFRLVSPGMSVSHGTDRAPLSRVVKAPERDPLALRDVLDSVHPHVVLEQGEGATRHVKFEAQLVAVLVAELFPVQFRSEGEYRAAVVPDHSLLAGVVVASVHVVEEDDVLRADSELGVADGLVAGDLPVHPPRADAEVRKDVVVVVLGLSRKDNRPAAVLQAQVLLVTVPLEIARCLVGKLLLFPEAVEHDGHWGGHLVVLGERLVPLVNKVVQLDGGVTAPRLLRLLNLPPLHDLLLDGGLECLKLAHSKVRRACLFTHHHSDRMEGSVVKHHEGFVIILHVVIVTFVFFLLPLLVFIILLFLVFLLSLLSLGLRRFPQLRLLLHLFLEVFHVLLFLHLAQDGKHLLHFHGVQLLLIILLVPPVVPDAPCPVRAVHLFVILVLPVSPVRSHGLSCEAVEPDNLVLFPLALLCGQLHLLLRRTLHSTLLRQQHDKARGDPCKAHLGKCPPRGELDAACEGPLLQPCLLLYHHLRAGAFPPTVSSCLTRETMTSGYCRPFTRMSSSSSASHCPTRKAQLITWASVPSASFSFHRPLAWNSVAPPSSRRNFTVTPRSDSSDEGSAREYNPLRDSTISGAPVTTTESTLSSSTLSVTTEQMRMLLSVTHCESCPTPSALFHSFTRWGMTPKCLCADCTRPVFFSIDSPPVPISHDPPLPENSRLSLHSHTGIASVVSFGGRQPVSCTHHRTPSTAGCSPEGWRAPRPHPPNRFRSPPPRFLPCASRAAAGGSSCTTHHPVPTRQGCFPSSASLSRSPPSAGRPSRKQAPAAEVCRRRSRT
eukprot:Sspe_Gene.8347::Locus_2846_Transcript_1_1_Confidence_1.000_Length_5194::g.8347::m.8347